MRSIVLLSGGLDSATALAVARDRGETCYALSVNYGQRSAAELTAATRVATTAGAIEHRTVQVDVDQFGGSALTDTQLDVPESATDGIPVTYVPARNTLFLALALGWAEVVDAEKIVIGVNAVDYSGYPDCRPAFIAAFEQLARLATKTGTEGHAIEIDAPLIDLTKAQIIKLGLGLGVDYAATVSCYQADAGGAGCGRCDACRLRRDGFLAAGVDDPTRYV